MGEEAFAGSEHALQADLGGEGQTAPGQWRTTGPFTTTLL